VTAALESNVPFGIFSKTSHMRFNWFFFLRQLISSSLSPKPRRACGLGEGMGAD
jgi:hypothetical protein